MTGPSAKREQQIKQAAIRVFAQKGFNGATTKQIALEAGVAEGTIFRYFKTKKDILLSLVRPYIIESLADTLKESAGKPDEVVLNLIAQNRLKLFKQNRDLVRLLCTEAQFHPELREEFMENIIMPAVGILERYIDEKITQGVYKDLDPKVAARVFVGMVGIFVLWKEFLFGDKHVVFDEQEFITNMVDIFLHGIRNNTTGV